MSTAVAAAPAVHIPKSHWTLTGRLKIQQERIRDRQYQKIARLTTIVMEKQMSTRGISQARRFDRCSNPTEVKRQFAAGQLSEQMLPLDSWQSMAWVNMTLDWLGHRDAPLLAISLDRNDLLLPNGLTPLPNIPDPTFVPKAAAEIAPRIPQKLEDRACGRIRDRISGKTYLIFQPLTELQVMCGGGKESGFGRIRCVTDPADGTHAALLINQEPDNEGRMEAYFVGGSFLAG